nr:transmembrane protein 107 isoform X2 [Pongo pygmaeus]
MGRVSGLVPSRFLTLLAHLVVVITLFWSRDSNIQACLPLTFTPEEYDKQDIQPGPVHFLSAGWWPRSLSPWASLQWSWPVSSQESPCSTAPRASSVSFLPAHLSHTTHFYQDSLQPPDTIVSAIANPSSSKIFNHVLNPAVY